MRPRSLDSSARRLVRHLRLSSGARAECRADRRPLPSVDPGAEAAVRACIDWLCEAQDRSTSHDGGVARHYSLLTGWSASYPETTGYIIPTLFRAGHLFDDASLLDRGRRMLDWLVSIQFPEGCFQGGTVDQRPVVPVTFNTGQILLGLAAGTRQLGDDYRESMRLAADWLTKTQDPDGCWRSHPTPFSKPGEKAYETHVAWGLLEAVRVEENSDWSSAAMRNVDWALRLQAENGWFDRCCLTDPDNPLTHTLGYVLRGVVEAWRFSGENRYLEAAIRTADGLLTAQRPDGSLPGRLGRDWSDQARWSCLTGNVQIAACWLLLNDESNNRGYARAASAANAFVRRTIRLDGPASIRGGVKGSFPVWGDYGQYEYLNWAPKFAVDAFLLEIESRTAASTGWLDL